MLGGKGLRPSWAACVHGREGDERRETGDNACRDGSID